MPGWWSPYAYRFPRRTCRRRPSWSTIRGGCRFDPQHTGPCKPATGNAWRPPFPKGA